MKKHGLHKYLTVWLFLAFLGVMLVLGLNGFRGGLYTLLQSMRSGGSPDFSLVSGYYESELPFKNQLISLNGGWQRLLGARSINQRYKLDNGHLTYTIPETEVSGIAGNTIAFREALREQGIPMIYVNLPFKIDPESKQLPPSAQDWSNENADRFLSLLRNEQIPILDIREAIREDGLKYEDLFYVTDHHWTAETGRWAGGIIADYLEEWDPAYAADDRIFSPEAYDTEILEDFFLGSSGKRTGPLYAGVDDFSMITPRFPTSLRFSLPGTGEVKEGSFEEALLCPEFLSEPLPTRHTYCVYIGADADLQVIENLAGTEELEIMPAEKKLLIIKDSFSGVLLPFLALAYEECHILDLRMFEADLMAYIENIQPDMVLVVYNPGAYSEENFEMFDFLS